MVKISFMIDMEPPRQRSHQAQEKLSVEERVKSACELVDSGHESRREWLFLKKLNDYLMKKKKLNKRQENVLKMIQPIMEKYGSKSPDGVEQKAEYHSTVTGEGRG